MSVGVNPPKTPVTKGSTGIAAATLPNICKMPGPPAPFVPAPLPNIGKSGDKPKGYTKKVKVEGNPVAVKGASFGSMGDMPSKGTGGGMASANTHGPCKFIGPGSMDVKFEGKNVQLLSDPMTNNGGASGSPANSATLMGVAQKFAEDIDAEVDCLHCGLPLSSEGHTLIQTNDPSRVKEANRQKAPSSAKTVGAMKVGSNPPIHAASGGGDGRLFNLKTKQEIPLTEKQRNRLGNNELGNCCEQKLLRKEFIDNGSAFPPEGGVENIKMGIAQRIKGRPSKKEIDNSKAKEPCEVCEKVLKAMCCTNDPAPKKGA